MLYSNTKCYTGSFDISFLTQTLVNILLDDGDITGNLISLFRNIMIRSIEHRALFIIF